MPNIGAIQVLNVFIFAKQYRNKWVRITEYKRRWMGPRSLLRFSANPFSLNFNKLLFKKDTFTVSFKFVCIVKVDNDWDHNVKALLLSCFLISLNCDLKQTFLTANLLCKCLSRHKTLKQYWHFQPFTFSAQNVIAL